MAFGVRARRLWRDARAAASPIGVILMVAVTVVAVATVATLLFGMANADVEAIQHSVDRIVGP